MGTGSRPLKKWPFLPLAYLNIGFLQKIDRNPSKFKMKSENEGNLEDSMAAILFLKGRLGRYLFRNSMHRIDSRSFFSSILYANSLIGIYSFAVFGKYFYMHFGT